MVEERVVFNGHQKSLKYIFMKPENKNTEEALMASLQQIQFSAADNLGIRLIIQHQIEQLIQNDFSKLIQILYTIDVSEEKLKEALINQKDTDTAILITDLIIERQIRKWKSKQESKHQSNHSIHDDEKW